MRKPKPLKRHGATGKYLAEARLEYDSSNNLARLLYVGPAWLDAVDAMRLSKWMCKATKWQSAAAKPRAAQ
jgi:hypothetical protein